MAARLLELGLSLILRSDPIDGESVLGRPRGGKSEIEGG